MESHLLMNRVIATREIPGPSQEASPKLNHAERNGDSTIWLAHGVYDSCPYAF